jgi:lipoprotein Spr
MDDIAQARAEIITDAAMGCIGTPTVPQGRIPGVGLDCVGLVSYCYGQAGLDVSDVPNDYPFPPSAAMVFAELDKRLSRASTIEEGDVLVLEIGKRARHLAICVEVDDIVHAGAREVSIKALTKSVRSKVVGIYRWRN